MTDIPVQDGKLLSRRKFLTRLSIWSGAFGATLVGIPVLGALLDPLINKPRHTWRPVGKLDEFPPGSTRLVIFTNADPKPYGGVTDRTAAWLRREGEENFKAFSVNCTHLGCPVRWEDSAQLFMCPCHGGVYNKDGSVAAGPPPEGLHEYQVRMNGNEVEIRTAPLPLTKLTASKA